MNVLKYRVSLDMFDTLSQITIKAKKGDSACQIHITLTEKGKIYHIGEGCYATFNAKKSDGNFIFDKCTIEDNSIVYDFSSSIDEDGNAQISACEGIVECEVTLYNAESHQLTSPRFTLFIDGTVYNGEEIASTPEANALKELINEAKTTIDEIETKLENGEFKGEDARNYVEKFPEHTNFYIKPDVIEGTYLLSANSWVKYMISEETNIGGGGYLTYGDIIWETDGYTEVLVSKTYENEDGKFYKNVYIGAGKHDTNGDWKNHQLSVGSAWVYEWEESYPDTETSRYDASFYRVDQTGGGSGGNITVDQIYNPESKNAQSGMAVAEAIENSLGDIETALDNIIAIQNELIGGGSV